MRGHTVSPLHSHTILGVYECGYLSDYQQLSTPNCYPKHSIAIAIGVKGAEIKKDTDNLSDYQCLNLILRGI